MASQAKSRKDKKKMWVRILCIFLCFLMVSSLVGALFGIF